MKPLKLILILAVWGGIWGPPLLAVDEVDNVAACPSTSPDSNPIYVNGYTAGLTAGMNQCRQFPAACGIGRNSVFTGTLETTPTGYNITIIDGVTQCQQDPASCNIVVEQNIDGSTEAGIAQCQQNPKSCGIQVKGTKEEGITQCRQDPKSCGITIDTEALIQQGMAICQANPPACGIVVNNPPPPLHATYSLPAGELSIPAVDILNPLDDTIMTYQVQLQLIPGMAPLSFSLVQAVPFQE